MEVRTRIWIEQDGKHVFGEGKSAILKSIDDTGSLNAAAREQGMSYRHVWSMVTTAEDRLGKRLVVRRKGGKRGGGTALTPYARELVEAYDTLKQSIREYADQECKRRVPSRAGGTARTKGRKDSQ